MADRYMHYGVEVIRQYVGSFRAELKKQGLAWVDLAIAPDIDVVVYNTIKGKRYALICPQSCPDDYSELVYITEQTPDDCNWMLLAEDIEAQHKGEAPKLQKTRVKMLLEAAEKVYYANRPDPINSFSAEVSMSGDEMIQDLKVILAGWGIDSMDLIKMDHSDVNTTLWKKLTEQKDTFKNEAGTG